MSDKTPREQIADILNIQNMADSPEINQLLNLISIQEEKARIDELEKIMVGQKTVRSYITGDGGEEQIVTYEFENIEIQERLSQLNSNLSKGRDYEYSHN